MSNKFKRVLAAILAMVMVLSLAACQKPSDEETTKASEQTKGQEQTRGGETTEEATTEEVIENFNKEGYPIVNEQITLKVLLNIRDADNMMPIDEMVAIKRLEQETGINLEWEVVKSSEWETKVNLMWATEEYPDIILAQEKDIDFEEYGVVQKVLIPLDELIEKYIPSYTERIAMESSDPTINLIASDGQVYSLGYMLGTSHTTTSSFNINQKWLDALKLPMPTNKEELLETLRKFKTSDPNGNGQPDEIPWSARMDVNSITTSLAAFLSWFGLPYDGANWIYIDDNKQIQFIPTQEGFRECMEWLHEVWDEGLLDVETFSQDTATHTAKVKNNQVGFSSAYNPHANWGAEAAKWYSAYVPETGTKMERIASFANSCAYITIANKYPEATARLFEYMIDPIQQYTTYNGEQTNEAGTSGWKINEAGLIESWQDSNHVKPALSGQLGVSGLFFAPPAFYQQTYAPSAGNLYKYAINEKYEEADLLQKYSAKYFGLVKLNEEQSEMVTLLKAELKTTMAEHFATFVKDGVTDASWNAFVKIFDGMKIDEYMKIYQDGINALDLD